MINNMGLPGLILIAIVVLVLFGRGKVSSLMGEVGRGITAFKKGVNEGTAEIERAAQDDREAAARASAAAPMAPKEPLPGTSAHDVTPPSSDPRV